MCSNIRESSSDTGGPSSAVENVIDSFSFNHDISQQSKILRNMKNCLIYWLLMEVKATTI